MVPPVAARIQVMGSMVAIIVAEPVTLLILVHIAAYQSYGAYLLQHLSM